MTDTALDMRVQVKRLRPGAVMPFYATAGSAGMDLAACIPEPVEIPPRGRVSIPTGIAVGLPEAHYVGLVFPRSGLASRHGIGLANAVGVIDSDYTGEIICPVQNQSDTAFTVRPGDRIAQLVFMPIARARLEEVAELSPTARGDQGFGSTGVATTAAPTAPVE